jgi:hypothetical protein
MTYDLFWQKLLMSHEQPGSLVDPCPPGLTHAPLMLHAMHPVGPQCAQPPPGLPACIGVDTATQREAVITVTESVYRTAFMKPWALLKIITFSTSLILGMPFQQYVEPREDGAFSSQQRRLCSSKTETSGVRFLNHCLANRFLASVRSELLISPLQTRSTRPLGERYRVMGVTRRLYSRML